MLGWNKHARLIKVQSLDISQCWNILSTSIIVSLSVKSLDSCPPTSQVDPFQTPMGHDNPLGCQHCHPAAPISPLLSVHVWSTKNAGPINVRVIYFTLIFLGFFFVPLLCHFCGTYCRSHILLDPVTNFWKCPKRGYKIICLNFQIKSNQLKLNLKIWNLAWWSIGTHIFCCCKYTEFGLN